MPAVTSPAIDTLLLPRWIVPMEGDAPFLEGHALALREGRIVAILPLAEAAAVSGAERVELPEHALLPGLVNTHSHAAMSLFRGYADDEPLQRWLSDHIWPAEGRFVGEEFVHDGALLAIAEMLRSGTTCFADMYFFPEAAAAAARQAGIRARLHFPIFDFPSAWGSGPEEYLHKGLRLRDDLKHSELLSVGFGPHAPYTVGDDAFARVATLVAELDAPVQIHLHETRHEIEESLRLHGERPLARLDRHGLLGPRTQCVHATVLDAGDIERLAAANAHVIHCPQSNLKLASGFCPVQQLLEAGINVALGTDSAASNNALDLFSELRTAALLAKGVSGNAAAVPALQALRMATLDGARALGLDHEIGSLAVGKAADVIAVDLGGIEQQPLYNPVSQLVYTEVGSRVTDVWVAGRRLLHDRQLTTLSLAELGERVRNWQRTIAATA